MNLIKKFFSPGYWFSQEPMDPFGLKVIFIGLVILLIGAVILRVLVYKKIKTDPYVNRLYRKISNLLFTLSGAGFIFWFSGYQGAFILGMRFWYLILKLIALVWIGLIIRYWVKEVPLKKSERKRKQEFERYLPKKRKK